MRYFPTGGYQRSAAVVSAPQEITMFSRKTSHLGLPTIWEHMSRWRLGNTETMIITVGLVVVFGCDERFFDISHLMKPWLYDPKKHQCNHSPESTDGSPSMLLENGSSHHQWGIAMVRIVVWMRVFVGCLSNDGGILSGYVDMAIHMTLYCCKAWQIWQPSVGCYHRLRGCYYILRRWLGLIPFRTRIPCLIRHYCIMILTMIGIVGRPIISLRINIHRLEQCLSNHTTIFVFVSRIIPVIIIMEKTQ